MSYPLRDEHYQRSLIALGELDVQVRREICAILDRFQFEYDLELDIFRQLNATSKLFEYLEGVLLSKALDEGHLVWTAGELG